jgi:uncharacterized protein YerC
MPAIHDLIEDWIQIRTMLQRQLKLLESDGTRSGAQVADAATEATIERIKRCLQDMNGLLKQYAGSDKP